MAHYVWTRDEMLISLKLYCELPYGKMNASNPEVIRTAKLIGRTPGAISLRLGNYASCDSEYTEGGRKGLNHGGKKVMEIWNEFSDNMEGLIQETDNLLKDKYRYESGELEIDATAQLEFPIGGDVGQMIMARRNQSFFRAAVLSSYNYKCCITGIGEKSLLIASHIKPWKDSDPHSERTNPRNGLCLNALHDRAFDMGLLTVEAENQKVILSSSLRKSIDTDVYENFFGIFEDQCINMPEKFAPDKNLLRYHNEFVFQH